MAIEGNDESNLVVKAYNLLSEDFRLPRIHAHLYKQIPTQAGLGGGSSDAAFMIRLLDETYHLNMGLAEMERYAAQLGADCAFFIDPQPQYAEGIGDRLTPVSLNLSGWHIGVVRPDIPVSTREAYSLINPKHPAVNCRDVVNRPVEEWRDWLVNDFEEGVFSQHPELGSVKQRLYDLGAVYAAMSGSGSALFGLFRKPVELPFTNMFTYCREL
jgi:4-diphosphocytidyl-2-C-methyl-D-erythritol kinase